MRQILKIGVPKILKIIFPISVISGCVTYMNFDQVLDSCVGKNAEALPSAAKDRLISTREEDGLRVSEYGFDVLKRCRWQFVIDPNNSGILSWRYPDTQAMAWCRQLPTSRP